MRISKNEVRHIANLASVNIDEKDLEIFSEQMATILEYVDSLENLNTKNVEPTYNSIFTTNAFREDKIEKSIGEEKALLNAPETEDNFFIVPKII